MKDKVLTIVLSVSMMLIGVSAVITTGASFLNIALPDPVIRALGIVQLLSVGTMAYSTVQKMRAVKNMEVKLPIGEGEQHEA